MASEEQTKIVTRILSSKTLYDSLNIKKDATTQEVVKQFKKMSILVHPDRNPHPQSSDAFKKINEAKSILSDEKKRKYYDLTGNTSQQSHQMRSSTRFSSDQPFVFYSSNGFRQMDEDVFKQFFFTQEFFDFQTNSRRSFRPQNEQFPFQRRRTEPQREREIESEFKALMPIILIFLFFFIYIGF